MGDDPKYLIYDTNEAGPTAFVFPCFIEHILVHRMLQSERPGWTLLSAGFCDLQGVPVIVYGCSVTLGVGANQVQDGKIIANQIVKKSQGD